MKWIRNGKKHQGKYLYYFLITFIVPLVIILIMNIVLQNVIKKQVLESGNKVLTQFFSYLDTYMENMDLDVQEIVEDEEIISFAKKNAQNSKMYAYYPPILQEKLKVFNKRDYTDILVWYAYDDRIISLKYPSRLIEDFYRYSYDEENHIYAYNSIDMETFYEVVKAQNKLPVFSRLEGDNGKQYLCITLGQSNSPNISYHFAVTIIMEQQLLDVMVSEKVLGEEEKILLYNENGELLMFSQEDAMEVLHEDYRKQGIYEIQEADGNYVLIVQECEALKGYYVMKISEGAFWEALGSVRVISWIGILCSLLAGGIVAWKFGNRTHQTFEGILESIKTDQMKREQKKQLEERKKRRYEFLIGVLESDNMEQCTIEAFEENEITLRSEKILVGILSFQKGCDMGMDMISFIVSNVFEELLEDCGGCYVLSLSTLTHVIVVNPKEGETEETLENMFRRGVSFLNEHMDVSAVMGCSRLMGTLLDIGDAYQNAQSALEYQFILEDKLVISFRDIEDKEFVYPFSEEHLMYQMIGSYLKNESGCCMAAETLVESLLEKYGIKREASMETIECFRYELMQVLNRLFIVNKYSRFEREECLERMAEVKGYTEYCKVLCEMVEMLADKCKSESMKGKCGERIWQYVEEHYADSNMNVTSIGDVFGMQAAYLSKIFKTEYGIALSDYISKVRINKSKQLLKEGKLTVGEVAEQVGFMSCNIYINNFKRWEGITPGKYRELRGDIDVEGIGGVLK